MYTSNIQFGYSCPRGGGQAIHSEILGGGQDKPPWTACPPPLVNM